MSLPGWQISTYRFGWCRHSADISPVFRALGCAWPRSGLAACLSCAYLKTRAACRQASVLDGHKLVLRLSLRKDAKDEPAKAAAKAPGKGTKLVVRNVAFEATRKDIVALFGPFGQVKSCRLPKKFDGSHRCVCFAVNALGGRVLFGHEHLPLGKMLQAAACVLQSSLLSLT